jgi:hypothetical protein
MLAFQAPSTKNPLKTKKYWLKITLMLAAAVIVTVILTAQLANVTQANTNQSMNYAPGEYSHSVLSRSIVLNPNGYYLTGFNVPDEAKTAVLQGNYTVTNNGTNNNCVMAIWSQQEFLNYFNGQSAVPCYNQYLMPHTADNLNITLSKGNYLIMISPGSVNTQILEAQLVLNFTV